MSAKGFSRQAAAALAVVHVLAAVPKHYGDARGRQLSLVAIEAEWLVVDAGGVLARAILRSCIWS